MTALQVLQAAIAAANKPALAKVDGMVYQVWQDGEITLQKSGDLLGQRTLHSIKQGCDAVVSPDHFPDHNHDGVGFIYTDRDGADAVRAAILVMED